MGINLLALTVLTTVAGAGVVMAATGHTSGVIVLVIAGVAIAVKVSLIRLRRGGRHGSAR
jgi:hypothetical protein